MADVVVDTDVVSFIFKGDTRAALYAPHLNGKRLVISFMTVAELDRWAIERGWGERRRAALEERLRSFLVYPFTRALCRTWAEAVVEARRAGRPISHADAWQAATALLHGIPLVTHNAADYAGLKRLVVISAHAE